MANWKKRRRYIRVKIRTYPGPAWGLKDLQDSLNIIERDIIHSNVIKSIAGKPFIEDNWTDKNTRSNLTLIQDQRSACWKESLEDYQLYGYTSSEYPC